MPLQGFYDLLSFQRKQLGTQRKGKFFIEEMEMER